MYNDPLFCYYLRKFSRLYQQLALLKPSMIQEAVADNPWRLLIAVTLLNKTSGKLAIPIFWEVLAKWPTPWALSQAYEPDVITVIQRLGTQTVRSKRLIRLSKIYLQDPPCISDLHLSRPMIRDPLGKRERYPPTPISHLPGTGPYALDSYRIFCTTNDEPLSMEWKTVVPKDKELIRYLKWKWAFIERKEWTPDSGATRPVNLVYLQALVSELTSGPNAINRMFTP